MATTVHPERATSAPLVDDTPLDRGARKLEFPSATERLGLVPEPLETAAEVDLR